MFGGVRKYSTEIKKYEDIEKDITDKDKKIFIMFLNYNSGGYLGQPVINDGEKFASEVSKFGYKCFYICNTSASNAANIIKYLIGLEGKKIGFFYSGHGTRIPDKNGDEPDGYDECFVFNDCCLVDDDFAKLVNENFKCDEFISLTDSCYSGTVWDLSTIKSEIKNKMTCVSSCLDNQTSAQLEKNGMFTTFFWKCFDKVNKKLDVKRLNQYLKGFNQKITIHAKDDKIDF